MLARIIYLDEDIDDDVEVQMDLPVAPNKGSYLYFYEPGLQQVFRSKFKGRRRRIPRYRGRLLPLNSSL